MEQEKMPKQYVTNVGGRDFFDCVTEVGLLTQAMNQDGYELICLAYQSEDNKFSKPTLAMLVFSKK